MVKIFFLLEVLATSVFTVYTFFLQGEEAALATGLAVFIASTPICLWLSKFLVIQFTKRVLRSRGITVNNSRAILTVPEVSTVAMPLRNFLTDGKFTITDVVPEGLTEEALLSHAASVEQYGTHALGRVIYKTALERRLKVVNVAAFSEIPGHGVEGVMNDVPIRVGTADWVRSRDVVISGALWTRVGQFAGEGKIPLVVSVGKVARGVIALKDEISSAAKSFVQILQNNGMEPAVLTATNNPTAKSIAQVFGVETLRTELMPDDKAREVQILRAKKQIVAVLGNETHDVPALNAGDVSIFVRKIFDDEEKAGALDEMDFRISALDKFFTLREIAIYAAKLIRINRVVSVLAWLTLVGLALTLMLDEPPFQFNPATAGAGVLLTAILVWINSMRMLSSRA